MSVDNPEFYERHWETAETASDPHIVAKADRILELVPEGVRTIVDVGCGDGYLTHRLAERWDVTAVDRSATALARVRCRTVQASADALPLPDASADLVFSSEVLEHLPDAVLAGAARELARVAKTHLMISVPHRETLERRFARCPRCALEFHIDGHLQSFTAEALDRLFPEFTRVSTEVRGPLEPPTYARIERLRHRVARAWWVWPGASISCPACGNDDFPAAKRGRRHVAADKALRWATETYNRLRGRQPSPYWLLTLWKRR